MLHWSRSPPTNMEPDLEKKHGFPLPLSGSMIFFWGGYGAVMELLWVWGGILACVADFRFAPSFDSERSENQACQLRSQLQRGQNMGCFLAGTSTPEAPGLSSVVQGCPLLSLSCRSSGNMFAKVRFMTKTHLFTDILLFQCGGFLGLDQSWNQSQTRFRFFLHRSGREPARGCGLSGL